MEGKGFHESAEEKNFISGIFNYCDSWCQRCRFTKRCRVFASRPDFEADDNSPSLDMVDLVRDAELAFEQSPEDTAAEGEYEFGEMSEEDFAEFRERRDAVRSGAEESFLGRASKDYSRLIEAWMEDTRPILRQQGLQLDEIPIDAPPDLQTNKGRLVNALQIVLWYQYFIHVKLMRALTGTEDDFDDDEEMAEMPKDSDGSAKVALIAMDKSLEAWGELQKRNTLRAEFINGFQLLLNELRDRTEERFPDARTFVRPGFDQEV